MFNLASRRALNVVKQFTNKQLIIRTAKDDVKIKWNRPKRLARFSPQRTGDIGQYEAPDPKNILLEYQYANELDNAEENVRNQFTLGWHDPKHTRKFYEKQLMDSVKSHRYDYDSEAAKIAQLTAAIRYYQHGITSDIFYGGQRRWSKYLIKRYARDRMLRIRQLREIDYKQYEWLLERLDLFYKPRPLNEDKIMIARKEGLRQLTRAYCDDVRQSKLNAYQRELEDQQLPFLEKKIQNLEFIRDEEKALDLQQTVTQENIDEVKAKYEALKIEYDAKKTGQTKKKWKVY